MVKNSIKLIALIVILLSGSVHGAEKTFLTKKEQIFLQKNPTIFLGIDDGLVPYFMQDGDDSVIGYGTDVLKLINKISGANFALRYDTGSTIREAKERRIDGLSTAIITDEISEQYNYSYPYATLEHIIFTAKDNPRLFSTHEDLKGMRLGVQKSNELAIAAAKIIPDVEVVEFENTEQLIEGVTTGTVDAMFGNAATFDLLNRLGNIFLKPSIVLHDNPLKLVFVIRNDFPEAITIINKSLEAIGQDKLLQLKIRWFETAYLRPSTLLNPILGLTNTEKEYLIQKQEITMCIDPDWLPFEGFDNGKHVGLTSDFFTLFQKDIGIPIHVIKTDTWQQSIEFSKTGECDILSFVMETKDRKEYLNFTTPYFKSSLVLATKSNVPFINGIKTLRTEEIGIVKGYAYNGILRKKYPNLNIVDVENNKVGLQKVSNGEIFGFIDTLASIEFMIKTQFIGELKVSGKFDEILEWGIGVKKSELLLLSIFNKIIKNISSETNHNILDRYVGKKYIESFDYVALLKILISLIIISSFFIYRYIIALNYNKKIEKYLEMINNNVLISSLDSNGTIVDVSEKLCKFTGYSKDELIGKNCNIFKYENIGGMSFKDMLNAKAINNFWQGETKNLKKDGSCYWTTSIINPIFDNNKIVKGYNVVFQDITDKKKLEKISVTDPLTKISNRLHLDNNYKIESKRAKRYGNTFSIILIDIDFFKNVNDTYGHKVGDTVLIQIAMILKQSIRDVDILGRWGGEEFLIICPETNIKRAEILAEKIRKIIEKYNFPIIGKITCSFGISQYHPDADKDDTFQRTDKALYKAKHGGRNSVAAVN